MSSPIAPSIIKHHQFYADKWIEWMPALHAGQCW
jgi:hypothetical protein